jgi:hypothetical protein
VWPTASTPALIEAGTLKRRIVASGAVAET